MWGTSWGSSSQPRGRELQELWHTTCGLLLRADCLCCGRLVSAESDVEAAGAAVGNELCAECGAALHAPWSRVDPPISPVPVFAAGSYGGPQRALILSMKEHLRPAAFVVASRVLEAGVSHLAGQGVIPDPRWGRVVLVPAPSRRHAARKRGGDIVSRICHAAAARSEGIDVVDVAHMSESAQDSVGLNRAERRANVSANIRANPAAARHLENLVNHPAKNSVRSSVRVIIVDDVCTTGATIAQFATVLRAHGVPVSAALVLAAA